VGNRFHWVKRVSKTAPVRCRRHELRHALCPGPAYSRRIEAALLPDQPGKEIDRQIIFCCCCRERITDGGDRRDGFRWRRGLGLGAFSRRQVIGLTCTRLPDK
jgi:hypothetical protein